VLVIGLTGVIGSGKSTVAGFMRDMGAQVIDCDAIGHESYLPRSLGWQKVVKYFGRSILMPDESVNRKALAEIVFNNQHKLQRLNRIVHPLIRKTVENKLEEMRAKGIKVAVIEAPLLIEAEFSSLVDEIWVITAPECTIYKRLKEHRKLSDAQIKARIDAHMPVSEQFKSATRVIDTNEKLKDLKSKMARIWKEVITGL